MDKSFRDAALDYHREPTPGKLRVAATKPLATQKDLALAYSPGVAAACEEIVADRTQAAHLTARGNLVAVITNGTAVLGLGNIGPLASKPVMEGKGVLFQKFAGIDVFDIEIQQDDPEKLVETIASLEPTFGGINLEDIKAPECFYVEEKLRERMQIPVFHDDQHGTAIICAAAVLNGMYLVNKKFEDVKLVTSGAGAAGIACLDILVQMGLRKENIIVTDREGVVYEGRETDMDPRKAGYAVKTDARTLAEALPNADIFLGVSVGGVLKPEMVKTMGDKPIILALANPEPEIMPDLAREVKPDAIIATGRSDFPNQVNNVLCFPYIFRGALDVGATSINDEMKVACVEALAALARKEASDVTARAYGGQALSFGPDYIIPKPFDPRLPVYLAPAVAKAAMDSGVATLPIEDMDAYRERMTQFVFRTGLVMKPLFDRAKAAPKRIVYAEGEEEVVLRAVQTVVDEGIARPILIGRPFVVENRIEKLNLRLVPGEDFELCNPEQDPRYRDYWQLYHELMARKGVTPDIAKAVVRTRSTVIAALMVRRGEADGMICGLVGRYHRKMRYVVDVLGLRPGVTTPSAVSAVALEKSVFFVADTHVNTDPNAEQIAESAIMAAEQLNTFGIKPRVALLSHSNFGSHDNPSANKMREALSMIHERAPHLEVEGEMSADAALQEEVRELLFPGSRLEGSANLFIMPNIDAAQIAFNMVRVLDEGVSIGPILMGTNYPAHVLTPSSTARRVVNMSALCVVDAQLREEAQASAQAKSQHSA
jgi:malate dehydrogenase (oxaloacetate-decarboxylating)(NADP+)